MKKNYFYQADGIAPIEELTNVNNEYETITFVFSSMTELSEMWCLISKTWAEKFNNIYKWHSVGFAVGKHSKMQELKLEKKILKSLSSSNFLKKNTKSKIFSYVENISNKVADIDLDHLTAPKYTALLFVKDCQISLEELWSYFSVAESGISANEINTILKEMDSTLYCRLLETDVYSFIQLMGRKRDTEEALSTIETFGFYRVNKTDIFKMLN